jgi:mannosyl-3-phosphoglycerate phosphatase
VGRSLLIVTDLDGTLLDERTYSFEPARPALAALERRGAGLVLASSKSRAEMEPLAGELGLHPALIVENGGAILVPRAGGGYEAIARGAERATLVRALAEIGREAGASPRGFASWTPEAVVRLTGLTLEAARRALERQYDEPFLLEDETRAAAVAAAAERRGLRVMRGGRFFHLTGATDKGQALLELMDRLAPGEGLSGAPATVGLGDAANDLPLLLAVERPIVMPRRDGRLDPELARALTGAEVAPEPGPAGWNAAVLTVLEEGRLPAVGAARVS